jgi:hypothetical protein
VGLSSNPVLQKIRERGGRGERKERGERERIIYHCIRLNITYENFIFRTKLSTSLSYSVTFTEMKNEQQKK